MSKRVRRRRFQRVIVWTPATGTILTLPSRYILIESNPNEEEEYEVLTSGSKAVVRRTSSVEVPLTHKEIALFGEIIQRSKCPVKAAFISNGNYDNWLWLEETRLQVRDPEIDVGMQAQKVIDLESSVFHSAIWESTDLIGGIPWQGTKGQKITQLEGEPIRLEPEGKLREGYRGPGWEVQNTSDRVKLDGSTQIDQGAVLEFEFPVWGATLRLEPLDSFSLGDISIIARDFNENPLKSVTSTQTAEIELPDKTWKLEIGVSSSTSRPRLVVKNFGRKKAAAYVGKTASDCNKVDAPDFTILPTPNTPPEWIQKERLVWPRENEKPTFTTLNNFKVSKNLTGGELNNAPTFEKLDDFTVSTQETQIDYIEPTIQATSALYVGNGGFSKIEWPGLAFTNFADNKGNGELAVDEDESYIFLARDNGIYRYDLTGGNETFIVGTDPFGVAVDQLNSKIYFTERNSTGIYRSNYDGSGEELVTDTNGVGYSIAVAPNTGNGGFIFGAYENELVRFDLQGKFKKILDEATVTASLSKDVRKNVHLDLKNAEVFYGKQTIDTSGETTYTDKVNKLPFGGGSPNTIISRSASAPFANPNNWTILQDERKWVRVETKENGNATISSRDLDGSNETVEGTKSGVDTGSYVVSAQPMS